MKEWFCAWRRGLDGSKEDLKWVSPGTKEPVVAAGGGDRPRSYVRSLGRRDLAILIQYSKRSVKGGSRVGSSSCSSSSPSSFFFSSSSAAVSSSTPLPVSRATWHAKLRPPSRAIQPLEPAAAAAAIRIVHHRATSERFPSVHRWNIEIVTENGSNWSGSGRSLLREVAPINLRGAYR